MTTPTLNPALKLTPDAHSTITGADAAATSAIRWPQGKSPAESAVHVRNELVSAAPAHVLWAWLLRAEMWPEWYPNAREIHFLSHAGPDLRDRSRFRWNTFGLRMTSKVLEFEPETRLSWDAHGVGQECWHGWVLTPLAYGGTHVLSEETQNGWMARLNNALMPGRLKARHQMWLEALSARAQSGMPGMPAS